SVLLLQTLDFLLHHRPILRRELACPSDGVPGAKGHLPRAVVEAHIAVLDTAGYVAVLGRFFRRSFARFPQRPFRWRRSRRGPDHPACFAPASFPRQFGSLLRRSFQGRRHWTLG